jgi:hypothetical protein
MKNATAKRRDFIFFLLLVIMVRVALSKKQLPQANPSLFAPANMADTGSSSFHEPDQKLMKRLAHLNDTVGIALITSDLTPEKRASLLATQKRLSYLLHKYEYTSPAFVLLGPIASTGIVLQEQSLEKELVEIESGLL